MKRKPTTVELRSLENPSTPLDPWDADTYGSVGNVSRETALTVPAFWRAISIVSGDVSRLPLFVYSRVDGESGEGKQRAKSHPLYGLLRYAPEPGVSASTFKRIAQAHMMVCGNSYSLIRRTAGGVPVEIRLLNPDLVTPFRINGETMYDVRSMKGLGNTTLRADEVLHFRGAGWDTLVGWSVLTYAAVSLGGNAATGRYAAAFWKNSARPNVILMYPGTLTPTARQNLLTAWTRMHAGEGNAHKTAILEEGLRLEQLTINAKDSQMLESREYGIREISNWTGVPAHRLGDTNRMGYNGIEAENLTYLGDIDPWLVTIEDECRLKLLTEAEKASDELVIEFERKALLRADAAARGAFYTQGINGGWLLRNEIRNWENLNPIPGGDAPLVPMNMQVADKPPAPQAPAVPPVADDGGAGVRSLSERLYAAVRMQHVRIAERCAKSGKPASAHAGVIHSSLEPFVGEASREAYITRLCNSNDTALPALLADCEEAWNVAITAA